MTCLANLAYFAMGSYLIVLLSLQRRILFYLAVHWTLFYVRTNKLIFDNVDAISTKMDVTVNFMVGEKVPHHLS